jgi:hypothetical protein
MNLDWLRRKVKGNYGGYLMMKRRKKWTSFDVFNRLPLLYYCLAILSGLIGTIVLLLLDDDVPDIVPVALIGYIVGAVLSMFAVGRVIEVLQQIRDAVRNNPALSPNSPDDE